MGQTNLFKHGTEETYPLQHALEPEAGKSRDYPVEWHRFGPEVAHLLVKLRQRQGGGQKGMDHIVQLRFVA